MMSISILHIQILDVGNAAVAAVEVVLRDACQRTRKSVDS